MTERKRLAHRDELAEGDCGVFEVDGREVALFNAGGAFYALENTCCHRGGPLGDGHLDGNTVTCPWHLWRFDVVTGECQNSPGDRVRTYDVIVEGDAIMIKL